jgi:hypothetical protein
MSSPKSSGPKSSPRRTAQEALSRAVKAAQRPRPDAPPKQNGKRASLEAKQVAATIERGIADGRLDLVSADALQALIAAACRLYAARREAGENFAPIAKNSLSATDVMVAASGLLAAADLAVFELGLWQGWTGR